MLLIGFISKIGMVHADEKAEQILEKARFASTLQVQDLSGHLRKDGKKTPIQLFLRNEDIQFQFFNGKEWEKFHMRLKQGGGKLYEIKNGKTMDFDKKKLSQSIMETDLTYQDLAMNFLYWKKANVEKKDKVKLQQCDVLRLQNPGDEGDYSLVYAWVHEKYGALMKVIGYNNQGKRIKEFAVDKLMKVNKEYTLRTMKVNTYDPSTRKLTGSTYLEFEKPKAVNEAL